MNNILAAETLHEIRTTPKSRIVRSANVKVARKRQIKKLLLPISALMLFSCSLLFFTFVNLGIFIQGYSISSLEEKQDKLLRELKTLKLEEAVLKRPDRIKRIARESLGLVSPQKASRL